MTYAERPERPGEPVLDQHLHGIGTGSEARPLEGLKPQVRSWKLLLVLTPFPPRSPLLPPTKPVSEWTSLLHLTHLRPPGAAAVGSSRGPLPPGPPPLRPPPATTVNVATQRLSRSTPSPTHQSHLEAFGIDPGISPKALLSAPSPALGSQLPPSSSGLLRASNHLLLLGHVPWTVPRRRQLCAARIKLSPRSHPPPTAPSPGQ